jgi:hypothetical protein
MGLVRELGQPSHDGVSPVPEAVRPAHDGGQARCRRKATPPFERFRCLPDRLVYAAPPRSALSAAPRQDAARLPASVPRQPDTPLHVSDLRPSNFQSFSCPALPASDPPASSPSAVRPSRPPIHQPPVLQLSGPPALRPSGLQLSGLQLSGPPSLRPTSLQSFSCPALQPQLPSPPGFLPSSAPSAWHSRALCRPVGPGMDLASQMLTYPGALIYNSAIFRRPVPPGHCRRQPVSAASGWPSFARPPQTLRRRPPWRPGVFVRTPNSPSLPHLTGTAARLIAGGRLLNLPRRPPVSLPAAATLPSHPASGNPFRPGPVSGARGPPGRTVLPSA